MNILFLDQFSNTGGGQRSLLDLLPAVREQGWSARVAIPGPGSYSDQLQHIGVPVEWIPCGPYTNGQKGLGDFARYAREMPAMFKRISALATEHGTDLLYVTGPRLLPAAALVARRRGLPLIFHCHHRVMQHFAVWAAGQALRWTNAEVIACCRFAAEPLKHYVREERLRIVYNGVSAVAPPGRSPTAARPTRIGVIGRIEPEKGQLEFIAAAKLLRTEFRNVQFVIVGAPMLSSDDYLRRVREASRGLPLEFLGWQDDIRAVFAKLDLLVVPSAAIDSTPRVIPEAFAARVPVVAFPAGGIPELIEDDSNGFLARDNSPEALASRIRGVLFMPSGEIRKVTRRALLSWQQKYTLKGFQEEITAAILHASS